MTLIIIVIGLFLILFNIRFIKDNNKGTKTVEIDDNQIKAFPKIFEDAEMDTSAADIIVGELRVEFSETILDLQKEIVQVNERLDQMNERINSLSIMQHKNIDLQEDVEEIVEDIPIGKMEQIGLLLRSGHSVDELCEKFQMGRGEIQLIQKLYQK